ncbi:MAG: hypothetical protein NTY71_07930 [Methanoregula sp.]|nr:hypothetical protein [Methanoregula sp.]
MPVTVMKRGNYAAAIALLSVLVAVVMVATSGCLKESAVAVTGINVGAEKITGSQVTLNVTTDVENTYGVSAGVTRVQLKVYDTETGLVVVDETGDAGLLGVRGAGSISQTIVLPRKGSYRLESTVYENNQRKGRGEITIYNLERLTPDNQEPGLLISDIDFLVKGVNAGKVGIQTDIYFTNENPAANGPFDVEVKAKEADAHLLADKQRTRVELIRPEATTIASVTLSVPDQYNYVFEVLIWKNDAIVKRGEGLVQLRPGTVMSTNTQFVTKKIETSKFVTDITQPSVVSLPQPYTTARTPGFTGLLAIIALGSLAVVYIIRRQKP